VIKFAKSAQTKRQTYDAIRYALVELGDNHSFFRESPIQTTAQMNTEIIKKSTIASNELRAQRLNDQIGFIRIPSFSGDNVARDLFAQDIQDLIRRTDRVSINAWVVDLRQNNGGNMWPMLAGIGPILGEGIAGYFVDPDSVSTSWSYANGQAMMNSMIALEIDKPYVLNNLNPSVAVLTDGRTGSSGEAMVVSFIGRNNTRSFGEPTYGVSTANRNFDLSDGAQIVLTVATMADRNGVLYGAKIEPDEIVDGFFKEDPSNDDEVVNRAVEWLENNLNKLR
jgi:C-terminal processing protease CtpA/Prc